MARPPRKPAPPTESSLFKGVISKLADLVQAHNTTVDSLEATDEQVAALKAEVAELRARPQVTPAEIESLLGDLSEMEIR